MDDRLDFRLHIEYIAKKIDKVIRKLKIIFRNTFGYGNAARKVMAKGCVNTLFINRLVLSS